MRLAGLNIEAGIFLGLRIFFPSFISSTVASIFAENQHNL